MGPFFLIQGLWEFSDFSRRILEICERNLFRLEEDGLLRVWRADMFCGFIKNFEEFFNPDAESRES